MNRIILSSLALMAFLSFSCKGNQEKESTDDRNVITVKHQSGTTEVVEYPKNTVILNYGIADTFEELDIDFKGTSKAILPSYLKGLDPSIVDVGNIVTPNMEKINELDPELIIISGRQAAMYEEFLKLAPTLNLNVDMSDYMESFKENQRIIGRLFDKTEEVEKELKEIDARIDKIRKETLNMDKKALIVLTNEGRMSAYGSGSRFGIIHDVFGLSAVDETIEVSTHGQPISNEFIQEKNPDYLFVIDRGAAIKRETLNKESFANDLIKTTNAYKNDKIIFLSPDIWYLSGGGLRSIKLMIDEVEKAIE